MRTKTKTILFLLTAFLSIQAIAQKATMPGMASIVKNAPTVALTNPQAASIEQKAPAPSAEKMNNQLAKESLHFTENKGQVADLKGKLRSDILFTAHSGGVKLFLTANGIHYQFSRQFLKKKAEADKIKTPSKFDRPEIDSTQFYRLDLSLKGANPKPQIIKEGEGADVENYYLAHCPNGILGVKNYSRITYKNVYPNIDWVVYTKGHAMEYDFVVYPGGNIADIQLKYDGAENINLDDNGALTIKTPLGAVSEQKPFSFQQEGKETKSKFVVKGNLIGFDCDYDKAEKLTIDPSIVWATYYGGSGSDNGNSCAVDSNGDVYLAGYTASNEMAFGGFQNTYNGNTDAFLAKFSSTGSRLWATYYGGSSEDVGFACCTDNGDNVYLAGRTISQSGIAYSGVQNNIGGSYDAFLVKFGSSGNRLWATYYGGSDIENGNYLCTDTKGNIFLAGTTSSKTGIAFGGFQNTFAGNGDAFLVKFNSLGDRLWATYYGGNDIDNGASCKTDADGNVYLAGRAYSNSGIAFQGFQNTKAGGNWSDGFLVKFSSAGDRLWATYYGGTDYEYGYSCCTDTKGNVYLAGYTSSKTGIASAGFQNTYAGYVDAFLVKFNSLGDRLWATYYGGEYKEDELCCNIDNSDNVYLSGYTYSTSGIASGGFQNTIGGTSDAFIVKFNSSGSRLWGTYFGGSGIDDGPFSCSDFSGHIYLAGYTYSSSKIAFGGFQNTFGGGGDAYLAKISDDGTLSLNIQSFSASLQNAATQLSWQTATELNTKSFNIQRSPNSWDFTTIGTVAAKGSNNNYIFTDNLPIQGTNYYRLLITDKDGSITYSEIRSINFSNNNNIAARIYPNPAKDKLIVELNSKTNTNVGITIISADGKTEQQLIRQLQSGNNKISINVAGLASGTYLLRITTKEGQQVLKFVKE